jgi:hypothetical protein
MSFNFPKTLHLIWDRNPLPFLNYLTIVSFQKYHPDWTIRIYRLNHHNPHFWKTGEQQVKINCTDFFPHIQNIEIIDTDPIIRELDISHLPTIQQSDILRVYLMYEYGGVYSDFDIIYTKNMEEYFTKDESPLCIGSIQYPNNYIYKYIPIAFLISKPQNGNYKYILDLQQHILGLDVQSVDYQCFGTALLNNLLRNGDNLFNLFNHIDAKCHAPICPDSIHLLYRDNVPITDCFGVHWFNGNSMSRNYINDFELSRLDNPSCTMDMLVSPYREELRDKI